MVRWFWESCLSSPILWAVDGLFSFSFHFSLGELCVMEAKYPRSFNGFLVVFPCRLSLLSFLVVLSSLAR
ncbi:hypothetical protein QBC46DRAFT_49477 [Diplogelasinospora grovesii]|uniref:Uncharacterized protein n=1 Tax=Diplogelasinospora grovesii TaxID=303347 RepID=A0AAN6NCD1_9PEZI|nr:hypothetical protein QBC46DRAFT_49477 [Diplogelasinospora grovesii]